MVMQMRGRGYYTRAIRVDKESETHELCSRACAVLTTACVSRRHAFPLARRSEIGRQLIKMLSIARFV